MDDTGGARSAYPSKACEFTIFSFLLAIVRRFALFLVVILVLVRFKGLEPT